MICLTLTGDTLAAWEAELTHNRRHISLAELRIDLLRPSERSVDGIVAWWRRVHDGLPCILTLRRRKDLGRWEGDDGQRLFLMTRLAEALAPAYIDLELDRQTRADWAQLARRQEARGGQIIRSYHGPNPGEPELSQLVARLATSMHEIPKVAVDPGSLDDVIALARAARGFQRLHPSRPALWIAMGEIGQISRLVPKHFGSAWTYASEPADELPPAPGQMRPAELARTFRASESTGSWPLLCVVGSPIAHSRSPGYHNARLVQDRENAVYVPVHAQHFEAFVELSEFLPIRGASVTVPHKQAALTIARASGGTIDPEAEAAGAANTIIRTQTGWDAYNTDVSGFLSPLRSAGGAGRPETGRAAVIGAGGAARAAVAGLVREGWDVVVFNRRAGRAESLAAGLGLPVTSARALAALADADPGSFDLVVQTTPVGMAHGPAGDPSRGYRFAGSETVYDLIYTPEETPMLARAAAAGCQTFNGRAMFEHQADAQYRLFRSVL